MHDRLLLRVPPLFETFADRIFAKFEVLGKLVYFVFLLRKFILLQTSFF